MADPVVIEQIAGERRRVTLGGAYLPNSGIRLGTTFRQVIVHPPSGGAPIRQKMGPVDNEFEIVGVLEDQPEDAEDGGAIERLATLEAMVHEGVDVRVTWGRRIDRLGVIVDFTPEWTEGESGPIPYSMTIQPHKVERRKAAKPRSRAGSYEAVLRTAQQQALAVAVAAKVSADTALAAEYGRLLASL